MSSKDISREELFVLVWEKPAIEVASDMGISDVALGKLCKRLQVPKPPRGYWAKIKSGQKTHKPPLLAFRGGLNKKRRETEEKRYIAKLSIVQMEFFKRALKELGDHGLDIREVKCSHDSIRSLSPSLAANMLILIQNNFSKWIKKQGASPQKQQGALQSVKNLVSKLLPIAEKQVVIFEQDNDDNYSSFGDEKIIVRLSTKLQEKISQLNHLVRENNLSYIVTRLGKPDAALSTRYIHSPSHYSTVEIELCVSCHEVWIRCKKTNTWGNGVFETKRFSLKQLIPIELIEFTEINLTNAIASTTWRPYANRLKALQEAEELYEKLSSDAYDMDSSIPAERLIMDRLFFGNNDKSPFSDSRRAWRYLEGELEKWEVELETERAELCQDILGIKRDDIVVAERGGQIVRIILKNCYLFISDENIHFHLSGNRYRKDGLPGKREEFISLLVKNDLK